MRNLKKESLVLLFVLLIIFSFISSVYAGDFFEIKVEPSNASEADSLTLLINRSVITHAEIRATETPENAWYKIDVYRMPFSSAEAGEGKAVKFLNLECRNKKSVTEVKSAIMGKTELVDVLQSCRVGE